MNETKKEIIIERGDKIGHCDAYFNNSSDAVSLLTVGDTVRLHNTRWTVTYVDTKRGQYIAHKVLKSGKLSNSSAVMMSKTIVEFKKRKRI